MNGVGGDAPGGDDPGGGPDTESRSGYVVTGYDRYGRPVWGIDPDLPISYTEYIYWKDPLTQPGPGTGGQDASLAYYLGEKAAQEEQYKIDSGSLLERFGILEGDISEKIKIQANVQGGGYGAGTLKTRLPGKVAGFPTWLLIAGSILWWIYK